MKSTTTTQFETAKSEIYSLLENAEYAMHDNDFTGVLEFLQRATRTAQKGAELEN